VQAYNRQAGWHQQQRTTLPTPSRRKTDRGTRATRAVRRVAVRWFGMLAIPWAGLVIGIAVQFRPSVPAMVVTALTGFAIVGIFGMIGLGQILAAVEQLDEERHGLREAYDRARLDALRDGLTGLGNHRAFQEELDELVADARSHGRHFALLYLDVDDLKKTNDARGHAGGDALLRATARILHSNMRRPDRGFRIGGDEFALLLADCGIDEGVQIGRRILASALESGAALQGVEPFSVTIGVSAYPSPATDRQQLIHQADAALYWGKRHGRTEVQAFDPGRHGMAEDFRPLEELASAVSLVATRKLLTPVYQPIYDLRTGHVRGYEGLVRPTAEASFPDASALFVAAEATGRTVELDLASLETVMAGAVGLDEQLYLSVNLSPRSLETEQFSPFELLALARRYGIDPTRLVVELTEREAVEDMNRLRAGLGALRRHGVRIAADDVGSGNAGLRLLSEVTFDIMKIDLSLVQGGTARGSADGVLRALRDMAERRGQVIVAEGVETVAQLEVLLGLGLESAQGYLLKRPGPALDAGPIDLSVLVSGGPAAHANA
jgi:diguanylate cyclase (GGDEF)-like protein